MFGESRRFRSRRRFRSPVVASAPRFADMPLLPRAELPSDYPPLRALGERIGFVPSIFPAQGLLPRAIEAETLLIRALLLEPGALSWQRKEEILVAVAAARRNGYCLAVHARVLETLGCPAPDIAALAGGRFPSFEDRRAALLDFSVRLAVAPLSTGPEDVERLRAVGASDEEILETVQTAALAEFLCALSTGLALEADVPAAPAVLAAAGTFGAPAAAAAAPRAPGAYLRAVPLAPDAFGPFGELKGRFGFVPALFRAQTLRPAALEAEVGALRDIVLTEDVLGRRQKELVQLVVSAWNLDTYGVALHTELLRSLGVSPEASDRVVSDHRTAELSASDRALLEFASELASRDRHYGEAAVAALRAAGFSDTQILEAIVTVSLANFLCTLAAGLNPRPDFKPRRDLAAERAAAREAERVADPDAELVARARSGDVGAFEDLIRRNQARIYRTLAGLTGSAEDAEDCCQSAFVKAFRKIGDFAGASRFSTWLTRIAINEGLERLRSRHPAESFDAAAAGDEEFRPSPGEAWIEDPERLYAREETRRLVRQELARLPVAYRTAVMLRVIEQLSTAEAAAVLDLPVPTLKTRLLRGRLMLREALAAHFAAAPGGARPA